LFFDERIESEEVVFVRLEREQKGVIIELVGLGG